MTKQLTLRGVDSYLDQRLKAEADQRGLSVNRYILTILREETGLGNDTRHAASTRFHDLDHLAGTWTRQDFEEFEQQLAAQRSIEADLWR